jgi:hypothetical protein
MLSLHLGRILLKLLFQNHRKFQKAMRVFVDEVVIPDALVRFLLKLLLDIRRAPCSLRLENKMESFLAKASLKQWRK